MFIRTKKIKLKNSKNAYKYAYLVSNSWKKKKVVQKVKKYLGRVYEFSRKENDFGKFVGGELERYLAEKDADEIVVDLVRWELVNHGFKGIGEVLVNNELRFDPKKRKIFNHNNKDVVIASNEGLLCTHLLRRLLKFEHTGEPEEVMYKFAKDFVELGVNVPKDVLVAIYEKVY